MRIGFVPWRVSLCLPIASAVMAQGRTAYSPRGGCYRGDLPGTPTVNTLPMPVGGGRTVPMTEAVVQVGPVSWSRTLVTPCSAPPSPPATVLPSCRPSVDARPPGAPPMPTFGRSP
jgi:hypothetical protein